MIVPVTPGYEARVLHYLDAPELNELERITTVPADEVPPGAEAEDLWLELLIRKHEDQAIGSGTLAVQNGQTQVAINADSHWTVATRDVGRELYIGANRYLIAAITDATACGSDGPQRSLHQRQRGVWTAVDGPASNRPRHSPGGPGPARVAGLKQHGA